MSTPQDKNTALKAMSAVFATNHLTSHDAIDVMACYVKHIGKKCGSEKLAAVLMLKTLAKIIPKLKEEK